MGGGGWNGSAREKARFREREDMREKRYNGKEKTGRNNGAKAGEVIRRRGSFSLDQTGLTEVKCQTEGTCLTMVTGPDQKGNQK